MKKIFRVFILGAATIILVSCSDKNIEEMTIKGKIEYLSSGKSDYYATTTDEVLEIRDDGNTSYYDMPTDEFYLSIAPYETYTHG